MNKYTQAFIDACLELSDNEHSKLSPKEHQIFGLSSKRLKAFLNNACSRADTKYLELGVYKGSTLLAAMHGNSVTAIGVESFTYDEREPTKQAKEGTIWLNMKSQLEDNIKRYKHPDSGVNIDNIKILEMSFDKVVWTNYKNIDVCFIDLTPVTEATYETFFSKVYPALSNNSLVIFSGYSNQKTSQLIDDAIAVHSDKFEIVGRAQRISGGLSDATKYYSGMLVLALNKKPVKATASK